MVLEALVVGQGASAEELVAWSRERLPGYKVPRRVRFVESLPITDGGKLLRGEL
jgi:long-chain acyl-CoA synthetase